MKNNTIMMKIASKAIIKVTQKSNSIGCKGQTRMFSIIMIMDRDNNKLLMVMLRKTFVIVQRKKVIKREVTREMCSGHFETIQDNKKCSYQVLN